MTSGHRAVALVAVWISLGGGLVAVVSQSFLTSGARTGVLVTVLAAAGVAATWLVVGSPGTPEKGSEDS